MWRHLCPIDGDLYIGGGEPCNWCGAEQPDEVVESDGKRAEIISDLCGKELWHQQNDRHHE